MIPEFIHLRLHSAYSLAEGAIKIDKLIALCTKHKMPAIGVTDTNNLFGALELSIKCADNGIKPIIGCQLNVKHTKNSDKQTSVLLYTQNKDGYQNLINLVSNSYLNSSSEHHPEITLDFLANYSKGLILLTGGIYGSLGSLLLENDHQQAKEYLLFLEKHFNGRLYIELSRHHNAKENAIEAGAISLAQDFNIPMVATNNVCYASQDDFDAHDALICIAQGKTIYDTERVTSSTEFYFKSAEEMRHLFEDLPEAYESTGIIAQRCSFMLSNQKPIMPQFVLSNGKTQDEELRYTALAGLKERLSTFEQDANYNEIHAQYFERLQYELDMISKMGFSGYFLIVADYVSWAKSQNIPVGPGRGSGAGSIVAWATKITDIDSIKYQLFFERFLNPDRVSMPDFDIDFCQERRDEVISYVQSKYGEASVAQIITFGKLQAKAVIRDIGRVLAMPYGFVDKISKMIPFHPTNPLTLQDAIDTVAQFKELIDSDQSVKHLVQIALRLEGLYRHPGIHAAGIVISDKILKNVVPLYKDARSNMPATQFSMKYIESAGLIKFDFLGLKTLTVIQKILDLIKIKNIHMRAIDIPLDDEKTFHLLKSVNCVGVFQIESAGMRDVLKKLQPDKLEDLIALVALYRPGPMDDIPKYINCKHGHEKIAYLDAKLEPILKETYGVMVYQEQVMQISQVIGGYTLGQADILRRAMGKKNKAEMLAQKKRFVDGAQQNGLQRKIAEILFEQMNKFAGYGFNKSHSTPYGLLTYQTAFLKANYMMEFFAAVMTCDMTNTDKLYIYYQDAIKNNIVIAVPDINLSGHEFIVDYENNVIRYSLSAIKGSGVSAAKEIVKERERNGLYKSIFDFVERLIPHKIINRRLLESFINSGAFDILHSNRKQLMDSMEQILSIRIETDQAALFEKVYPELKKTKEWSETEKLQNEFSAIGFYVTSHPMQQYEALLKQMQISSLYDAQEQSKSKVAVIINGITNKTSKNQNKFCILQVSDVSGVAEITLFSEILENARNLLEVGNIVCINLSCHKNEDHIRMVCEKIQKFDPNNCADDYYQRSHAASTSSAKEITIKIHDKSQLEQIKTLIENFKLNGSSKIHIAMPNKNIICLKDGYLLSEYDIFDLRNVVGIHNVIEKVKQE